MLENSPVSPELSKLLQYATKKRYANKQWILQEGAPSTALFYLIKGSVTVLVKDEEGGELILAYLDEGEFFGELNICDSSLPRSASVRAYGDCEVAIFHYERVWPLLRDDPVLLWNLFRQTAHRLRMASRKLGDLAFVDAAGRIARALLELAESQRAITHPDGMLIRITREELGKLVNCSRQLAGQVLQNLEAQGLISASGKSIVIRRTQNPDIKED